MSTGYAFSDDLYTDEQTILLNARTTLRMLQDRGVLKVDCRVPSVESISTDGVLSKELFFPMDVLTEIGKQRFPNGIGVLIAMYDICMGINAFPVVQAFLKTTRTRKILIPKRITQSQYRDILDHYDGVEIFRGADMLSPTIDHVSQPTFEPYLTDDEINETINNYQMKADRSQFQEMYVTDPVARYYNLDVGAIVRITRSSSSAIRSINFRRVVPSSSNMMFEIEY